MHEYTLIVPKRITFLQLPLIILAIAKILAVPAGDISIIAPARKTPTT